MSTRQIKYWEALSEGAIAAMDENPRLFMMGEGIDDPKGTFGTTLGALKKFGPTRVFDTPLSESAMTGIGIGAAIEGFPNVMIHMRSEFMLLAMDQIINHAAKWHYMTAGEMTVPIVIRCIVGRGWGQAAQHSQSFHSLYAHIPGLKVILPATPFDAKGLLYSAMKDPNPVICIEHRWLYDKTGTVPEETYSLDIGKAEVIAEGKDITCVALSYQVLEALSAREALLQEGIEMEVINLRSVRPLDFDTIISSVKKTGRLVVTDIGHLFGGISSEIAFAVQEKAFSSLKAPITKIGIPDFPTPCSVNLEEHYYPNPETIAEKVREIIRDRQVAGAIGITQEVRPDFQGPF